MDMTNRTSPSEPLNSTGVDFSNETQATDFLSQILDDSEFQVVGNAYARYFWYGIVVFIGVVAFSNVTQVMHWKLRTRSTKRKGTTTAAPDLATRSLLAFRTVSSSAFSRQFTPAAGYLLKVPPLGTLSLILIYLGFIISLEFFNNNTPGAQHYTALGVRAAWLGIAQVPLLVLLAGKNNLIGFITGSSYERLNVYHRWVARSLLLTQTLHFGFQSFGWNKYGLMQLEWKTDICPTTGIAAYALLLWMNLSTLAPIRNFSYEFFVVQHVLTFFGLIIAIMLHLPTTALYSRTYIFIGIGIYFLDRFIRTARCAYHNFRPARATLTALDGATKIRISSKQLKDWSPGAHVFVSIPRFGIWQSHPATIASIPSSHANDIVLILKAHKGFTKRIMRSANSSNVSVASGSKQEAAPNAETRIALIDGPYGASHPNFTAFDTVHLISASTGVTFTLSILLDIAHRASSQALPVRQIEFVWVVKKLSWISWVSEELQSASEALRTVGIDISIVVYFTQEHERDLSTHPITSTGMTEFSTGILGTNNAPSWATVKAGRPSMLMIDKLVDRAEGLMGVAVCGPVGMGADVRNAVAEINRTIAMHGRQRVKGVVIHSECFSW